MRDIKEVVSALESRILGGVYPEFNFHNLESTIDEEYDGEFGHQAAFMKLEGQHLFDGDKVRGECEIEIKIVQKDLTKKKPEKKKGGKGKGKK